MSELKQEVLLKQEDEQFIPKLENEESDNASSRKKQAQLSQYKVEAEEEEQKKKNEPDKENIPQIEQKSQGQNDPKQEKEQILGQQQLFIYPEQIMQFQQLQAQEGYGQHQNQSSQIHQQSNSLGIAKRKNKKRMITNPNQQVGHWSDREHKTYLNFLMAHKTIMESQDMKKTSKIFKLMSEIIGTRSPSQCRSHHQKFNPFVHHIKKRQKGAGRKKKEAEIPVPKKQEQGQGQDNSNMENSNAMLQQFMIQNPPFYMPQSYLMNQQTGQNMGFLPDQQVQQNQDLNYNGGGQPMLNFPQLPSAAQIQQLLRPTDQEEVDKQGNYMMGGMKDQMVMPPLQLPSMFQIPPQQNWYPQQFAMPTQQSDDKNQYYNFSFIQAPLSFNINYMAPPIFNQDGGMPPLDNKQMDMPIPGPQHFSSFFPYFLDDQQHQMILNQNDLKQQ